MTFKQKFLTHRTRNQLQNCSVCIFYSSPVNRIHYVFLFQPCQQDSPCISTLALLTGLGLTMHFYSSPDSPHVSRTHHVSTGLVMCQLDLPCVNRTRYVSKGLAMCQQDSPCVNRTCHVSTGLAMCQQDLPCVNRTRQVSLVRFPFKLRAYNYAVHRETRNPPPSLNSDLLFISPG